MKTNKYIMIGASAIFASFLFAQGTFAFPQNYMQPPKGNLEQMIQDQEPVTDELPEQFEIVQPQKEPIVNEEYPPEMKEINKGFKLLNIVGSIITNNYNTEKFTSEDFKKMFEGAAKGMFRDIDPYSTYMTAEEFEEFRVSLLHKEYGGIGAQLHKNKDNTIVLFPYANSPADKAGLKKEDILLEVDDYKLTLESTLEDVVKKIRGPKDTKINIKILRENKELEYTVTREMFSVPDLTYSNNNGLRYIEILTFGEKTGVDFKKALQGSYEGLVIDLRNNPGGYLGTVLEMLGEFYPQDKLLLKIESKKGFSNEFKDVTPERIDKPVAVIINRYSASASEIMAGVLQDYGTTILGETSFGKGLVQSSFEVDIENDKKIDGYVKLTTSEYVLPSGKHINKVGVIPDIAVPENEDPLVKAFQHVKQEIKRSHEYDSNIFLKN